MDRPKTNELHVSSYVTGFLLSLALTLSAYFIVVNNALSRMTIILGIGALAILQLMVQLFFFLHLGHEKKPRWKLVTFLFMLLVLIIVVVGSLWIMYNLNYHTMSQHDVGSFIQKDEGIQ